MKNESFKSSINLESADFSADAIMDRLARMQRGGKWTRRAIERAQEVGNNMLGMAYANNIPLDVFVEAGGHTIYCDVDEALEPIHCEEGDATLWGSMSQFVVKDVQNEMTRRHELTLCMLIDSHDKYDMGQYWIPIAATDSKIPKIKFMSVTNVLEEDGVRNFGATISPERSYRDAAAEMIFADGGTTSEKVMNTVRELYYAEGSLDVEQLTTDVNMLLLRAAREEEELDVEFCGEIERQNGRGGWDIHYENEQPYTLIAIEFFDTPSAADGIGAYAYMEDSSCQVVRADMSSNNFAMASSAGEEMSGYELEDDEGIEDDGSYDIQ